jgi:murein DD-endopeptidase MepM/ murein hydrolase activator NlpD
VQNLVKASVVAIVVSLAASSSAGAINLGHWQEGGEKATSATTIIRGPAEPTALSAPYEMVAALSKGDTLASVLNKAGVPPSEAHAAIAALRPLFNPRHLQVGQEVSLTLATAGGETALVGLEIESRFDRFAGITRYPDGSFQPYEQMKQWNKLAFHTTGSVKTSLFADGVNNGAPPAVMADFLRLFSFDVDFQRDIQPDDEFETVFERYQDQNGKLVHSGNLLFASLNLQGIRHEFFRFGGEHGDGRYYDRNGNGMQRALLRTPIDGARLTSGYGSRRDPMRGYRRSHKGVDFAAPTGTPIRAAGDGVLSFVGRQRGYGRFITIKHNGDYTTAYAHMSRFAKGMSKGKRVRQGQIIAYVGSSGRSTGPHLHYEVRYKGKQVNPNKLRLPSGKKLDGQDLLQFQEQVAAIEAFRKGAGGALAAASPIKF